ncbi:hypothetical protein B5S31_g335 [[Candida] boidinii]|uniref:Unnamed protein product n=1 Tax=Candida boidinii TaxID=5477 RepID=A0ACB5TG01_CANBO|nr:hypothetical protein B5S29_g776 [[Candida] boidinii]OWB70656.1 hypothetical protein B5S31_g335 [[Candida] boidinii]OWB76227.1 hypothetical protein B5S32_g377 [[Candida] boidinii]GME71485.1 unnamed protein product [[Candida] boidinii]GME88063.1 unnamed protein product [[Candida] boidinii]
MYNPYSSQQGQQQGQSNPYQQHTQQNQNAQHRQQQQQQQQQQSFGGYNNANFRAGQQAPQGLGNMGGMNMNNNMGNTQAGNTQGGAAQFNNFFSDPTTAMGIQFSQTAFNAGQQYMQQNFGTIVDSSNIKYYFKVSNSYVLQKLLLILFPFKNRTWTRIFRTSTDANNNPVELYAPPTEDVNAPDLYIPLMSFMSYILVWAIFSGINGTFHPQLLGFAATRTLSFSVVDVALLKIVFYVLNIQCKLWDIVSYSGYKYTSIVIVMLVKGLYPESLILTYITFFAITFSLGFFLMRSLRYVVLPTGLNANNISQAQKKIRTNFLFVYSFVVQFALVWLMS